MQKQGRKKIIGHIIFAAVTIIMLFLSALTGYHLAQRYKETISNTYNKTMDNVTSRIDSLQSNVLDETSKIKENQNID